MTAKIDSGLCIGCTLCAETCPGVFRMEGDKAVVYASVAKGKEGSCRKAAEECPVNAIRIEA
jgi:ferredoxin